jgi:hypothetical protein
MPAYQSVPEFDLSRKYHLKAAGNAPNAHPIRSPNRNGKTSPHNGIRWRIKPPGWQAKPGWIASSEVRANVAYFKN